MLARAYQGDGQAPNVHPAQKYTASISLGSHQHLRSLEIPSDLFCSPAYAVSWRSQCCASGVEHTAKRKKLLTSFSELLPQGKQPFRRVRLLCNYGVIFHGSIPQGFSADSTPAASGGPEPTDLPDATRNQCYSDGHI
ncbi:hypothetical protein FVEG_14809 [Fusarium verticillioides 7600]|uniref:Uncharacterized protein n=1 Tax=Gibberella moniliformis (strain M3125 / FGSC 7600) TaxID=334819 RepID=W7LEM4_GIBM7|nr:hypothetical protein FVEG_14809 [Fusarium verticillioides 7600]EWG37903.1 hypothetical protein FVEG_14809 [Fusarium verticillioides 7600]